MTDQPASRAITPTPDRIELAGWAGPEVAAGDDLAALICHYEDLRDGDIIVITSKVVSKSEGRDTTEDRVAVISRDTTRVVARKGHTVISQTAHGLVLAAAGVDQSNTEPGRTLSLPEDADASARRLRVEVLDRRGINAAVVITDTAGRAWRVGQVDIAIGCAGIPPVHHLAGTADPYGNPLAVTATVHADEIAAAADLVKGKTSGRPFAVVRGLAGFVLPAGQDGPGARAIVRDPADDMFGLGARDAVIAAVHRDPRVVAPVPVTTTDDRAPFDQISSALEEVRSTVTPGPGPMLGWICEFQVRDGAGSRAWVELGRLGERVDALAWAHRLRAQDLEPSTTPTAGWRAVSRTHWFVA